MAFNKIQPEQIQLHTFFSDSGDLNIVQSNTGVQLNLSKGLTGDFSFTGNLTNNGRRVAELAPLSNNSFDPNLGNILFLGGNNAIGGGPNAYDNFAISSNNSTISGINNAIFRADSISFETGSQENVCLAGHGVTFTKTATGSAVLKDNLASTSLTVTQQNAFYAQFSSGHFFEGGSTYFDQGINVGDGASGIFSGNLEVLSDAILSGSTIVNEEMFNGSHTVTGITRFQTGFALPRWLGNDMGSSEGSPAIEATGALAISGNTLCVFVSGVGGGHWAGIGLTSPI